MANGLYETDFEEATIGRLQAIGYEYTHAMNLFGRTSLNEVVLRDRLEAFLKKTYPGIPAQHIPSLVSRFADPDGVTLLQRNQSFHEMLVKGVDFSYEEKGEQVFHHVYPVNWEEPLTNNFLVVNQLSIEGKMARRPDLIIYVNGLPLVVFELKSPYSEQATIEYAYNQITNYTYDIAQLFNYNAFAVISDGILTLHGIPGAPYEFYAAWKSTDGKEVDNNITNSMRTLIQGMFPKERLLDYIRNFIVFMKDGNKEAIKIGAKYHQYFGVGLQSNTLFAQLGQMGIGRSGSFGMLQARESRFPCCSSLGFCRGIQRWITLRSSFKWIVQISTVSCTRHFFRGHPWLVTFIMQRMLMN